MNKLRFILPPVFLLLGIVLAVTMVRSRKPAETRGFDAPAPLVRVMPAVKQDYPFTIDSQGTVVPRTEISIVSEVNGRVTSVSRSTAAGGFFDNGQVLAVIEDLDYRSELKRARRDLESARLRLAQEEAQAEVARDEWKRLGGGEATPLTLREPQVAEARAAAAAAEAQVRLAERNLDRTRIRAPFAGRVRSESIDAGQFVTRGTVVATVYATDHAEVRLPMPDGDAAFVDLPLGNGEGPEVILTARFAGDDRQWKGRIVRTEGEIDPRSRMVYAVARIDDPFGRSQAGDAPPLAVGLFVQARIVGRLAKDVVVIPRSAVRNNDQVLIVDANDQIRIRRVDILRTESDRAIVGAGIEEGDRVCLSALEAVVDGMKVRTADTKPPAPESLDEEGLP